MYRRTALIAASLIALPFFASAQTADQLAAMLVQLQQQLAQLQGGSGSAPAQPVGSGRCVIIASNLARGQSGGEVTKLQQYLAAEGLLDGASVTGYYGPLTENAVQRWQAARGIVSSGTADTTGYGAVGPKTRAAMANCATVGSPTNVVPGTTQCPVVPVVPTCPGGNVVAVRAGGTPNSCIVGWNCTSQVQSTAQQSLQASPISGAAPLTVTFNGTIAGTNAGLCDASGCKSALDFGDGTKTYINHPTQANTVIAYSVSHTYQSQGTFTAILFQGEAGAGQPRIGERTITISGSSATLSLITNATTTPPTLGGLLSIAWNTTNAPSGSKVRLEVYPADQSITEGNNDRGISSKVPTSGVYAWRIPSPNAGCLADSGLVSCMQAGLYKIVAKLYSGSECWGFCAPGQERTIHTTAVSEAFVISTSTTSGPPGSAGQPKITANVNAGNDRGMRGSSIVISWEAERAPSGARVRLELYTANGTKVSSDAIAVATSTSGYTTWQVPTVPPTANCTTPLCSISIQDGSYKIRATLLSDASASIAEDDSNAFPIRSTIGAGCLALTHNLSPGDTDVTTSGEVTKLQQFLAQDPEIYPEGLVTGSFGSATTRAVQRWQAQNGVAYSGTPESTGYGAVGPKTRALMALGCGNTGDVTAAPSSGVAPLTVTFTLKGNNATYFGGTRIEYGDGTMDIVCTSGTPCGTVTKQHTYTTSGAYVARYLGVGEGPSTTIGTATIAVDAPGSGSACAAITRTLSPEDTDATTNGDVSRLQQFLAKDPALYPEALVTGYFGPATMRAVQRYQARNNLVASGAPETTGYGRVGETTLAKIRCASGSNAPLSASPSSGGAPLNVTFTINEYPGTYQIDFGDGTTRGTQTIVCATAGCAKAQGTLTHTYSSVGSYTARLLKPTSACLGLTGAALQICEIGQAVYGSAVVNVSASTGSTNTNTNSGSNSPTLYACPGGGQLVTGMHLCPQTQLPGSGHI